VDIARPQRKRAEMNLEKKMWKTGFSYSKIEAAAQDTAGWNQVVCDL